MVRKRKFIPLFYVSFLFLFLFGIVKGSSINAFADMQENTEVSSYAAETEEGTEANPYLVSNATELKSFLEQGKNTTATLYLQLTSDITYTDSDQFTIYSNVVVNGQKGDAAGSYYKMLKTGTSTVTSNAGFYLNSSGYDVTFENMSFGDSSYSYYQTYYGILLGASSQVDLTIRNVDYYGSQGGQPLCNYNAATTFTFEGTNHFNVTPGTNSQEFIEGVNLTFAKNSVTIINQNSTDASALIYNSISSSTPIQIDIQENAQVNVTTNKTYFTYGASTINLNLADSATFIYSSTSSGFNFANVSSYTSNYVIGKNATFSASGAGKIGSSGLAKATFNVADPAEVSFENTSGPGLFSSTSTLVPSGSNNYLFDYTVNGAVQKMKASSSTIALADSSFASNVNKVVYYPIIAASFDVAGTVNDPTASLNAESSINLSNIALSAPANITKIEYKIFDSSPLPEDADITSDESQSTITNSSTANYTGTDTSSSFAVKDVPAKAYVVFIRVAYISSSGRIEQTTAWVSKPVDLKKSVLNVTVPTEMTFSILDNSLFQSDQIYTVTNRSNFKVSFGIDSVSEVEGITLVEDIEDTDASNPLYLALKGENDGVTLPFVTSKDDKAAYDIPAFGGSYGFKLVGQYGGAVSLSDPKSLQYTLTYVIGSN